ncbi:uncharacterized protein LOC135204990 [Macrobrachium nipponense]|uniref:uncharacterized protein LOC135204990 n=1 Tax=Macrobrachium nipponense TaxID=159736 RepID=UPI0030C84A5C
MTSNKFDDILTTLGTGRWNILFFICDAFCELIYPPHYLSGVYLAPEVGYTCIPPDYPNVTGVSENSCSYYMNTTTAEGDAVREEHPCTDWVFDNSTYKSTLTSEFKLVCGQAYLKATYQGIPMMATIFTCTLTGYLSDRYGRKTVMVVTQIIHSILTLSIVFANDMTVILVLRFLQGIFATNSTYALALEACEVKWRSIVGILIALPWALGMMAWGGIAYLIRDWRILQLSVSLPLFLRLGFHFFIDESPRWLILKGQEQRALKILHKAARLNGSQLPSDERLNEIFKEMQLEQNGETDKKKTGAKKQFSSYVPTLFRTPKIRFRTILLSIIMFTSALVYTGLTLSGDSYSTDPFLYIVLAGLMETPAYTVAAPLINWLGRKKPAMFFFTFCGVVVLALAFIPDDVSWLIMTLAMLGKLCNSMAFMVLFVYMNELFPTEVRMQGCGFAITMVCVGTAITSYVTDYLGPVIPWAPSVIFGLSSLVATLLLIPLPETRGMPMIETVEALEGSGGRYDHAQEKLMPNTEASREERKKFRGVSRTRLNCADIFKKMVTNKLEDLLTSLGTGPWNLLYFLCDMYAELVLPAQYLNGVFLAPEVGYTCVPPENHTGVSEDSCSYYVNATTAEGNTVREVYPCTDWVFDNTTHEWTLTSEFQLVCGKAYLKATYQGMQMIATIFTCSFTGYLSDRFGRKTVLVVTQNIHSILCLSIVFSRDFTLILALRFLQGCVSANGAHPLALEVAELRWRSVVGIIIALPWSFGMMAWGGMASVIGDWRILQVAVTLPLLLRVVFHFLIDESPRWLILKGKEDEAIRVLRKAARWNKVELPSDERLKEIFKEIQDEQNVTAVKEKREEKQLINYIPTLLRTPKVRSMTILLSSVLFSSSVVYAGLTLSGDIYSTDPFLYIVLGGVMEIPAYTVAAPLINWLGKKKPIIFFLIFCGVAVLALAFIPEDLSWLVTTLAMLGKLCNCMAFMSLFVYLNELFPTEVRMQGLGVGVTLSCVGSAIAPYVTDYLGPITPWAPSVIFGLSSIVGSFLLLPLPETKGRPMIETVEALERRSSSKTHRASGTEEKDTFIGAKSPNGVELKNLKVTCG